MAESFLGLSLKEQAEILQTMSTRLSRTPAVLEKDVWVCWALKHLFEMPGRQQMAFKGGTSLSKVYGAIDRFSEDIDITLDYRGFAGTADPFEAGISKTKQKRIGEELIRLVGVQVTGPIATYLSMQLKAEFPQEGYAVVAGEDLETLRIHYVSAVEDRDDYVLASILLEFGGRNITEPNETRIVRPDIAVHLEETGLEFPQGSVDVLSAQRTFWEKATLIHTECQRFKEDPARLSRHWYDLYQLADSEIGTKAVADRALLADVIKYKKVFYNSGFANYDACLESNFMLVPEGKIQEALNIDYQKMKDAGMFWGGAPDFEKIIGRLADLQSQLNAAQ